MVLDGAKVPATGEKMGNIKGHEINGEKWVENEWLKESRGTN